MGRGFCHGGKVLRFLQLLFPFLPPIHPPLLPTILVLPSTLLILTPNLIILSSLHPTLLTPFLLPPVIPPLLPPVLPTLLIFVFLFLFLSFLPLLPFAVVHPLIGCHYRPQGHFEALEGPFNVIWWSLKALKI